MRPIVRAASIDREALWVTLAVWGLTYCVFLLSALTGRNGLHPWHVWAFLACIVIGLLASAPLYLLIRRTQGRSGRWRLLVLGLAGLAAAVLVSTGDSLVFLHVQPRFEPGTPLPTLPRFIVTNLFLYLPIFAFYVTALVLIGAGRLMRERERQLAEARSQAHQAQLAALRFQLNPHFLFNTLNAISTLIVTHRNDEAESMMQKLSDFLRASLSADPAGFTTLEDELATTEAYLDIEAVRFGERLRVAIACPPWLLDAQVPSFLLQPLVENAVKYAVAPSSRRVTIHVDATADDGDDDLVLTIEDDGEAGARGPARSGTGVGLANVRERLKGLYGERGVLEAAPRSRGFLALVRLPLTHVVNQARSAA